jgi:nucleotidyltransferase/DNA polymerase involved in DNA repair
VFLVEVGSSVRRSRLCALNDNWLVDIEARVQQADEPFDLILVNQAHVALIKERRRLFEIFKRGTLDDNWENASVDEVFDPNRHDVSTLSIVNLKLRLFVIDLDRYGWCHFTFSSDINNSDASGFDDIIFGLNHDVQSSTNFAK